MRTPPFFPLASGQACTARPPGCLCARHVKVARNSKQEKKRSHWPSASTFNFGRVEMRLQPNVSCSRCTAQVRHPCLPIQAKPAVAPKWIQPICAVPAPRLRYCPPALLPACRLSAIPPPNLPSWSTTPSPVSSAPPLPLMGGRGHSSTECGLVQVGRCKTRSRCGSHWAVLRRQRHGCWVTRPST